MNGIIELLIALVFIVGLCIILPIAPEKPLPSTKNRKEPTWGDYTNRANQEK